MSRPIVMGPSSYPGQNLRYVGPHNQEGRDQNVGSKKRRCCWISFGSTNGCAGLATRAFFIFIFQKKKFKNICRIEKFSKMGACRPRNGRQGACRPSSGRQPTGPKCKKKLHLGPDAQGALNSELVKLI